MDYFRNFIVRLLLFPLLLVTTVILLLIFVFYPGVRFFGK